MARDEAYREAEQRIEAARQAGATELDLSGMELTEVPEAIAALTQLQGLYLSFNKLTARPEAIASLTQLQELDLSGNQLTKNERRIPPPAARGGGQGAAATNHRSLDSRYTS
ncbi:MULTISPECIES: leucine-rich repeat domain-containing protein [unclassified Coleofasciculus]|uniref:leucine-rich repeat domain-containing protein n=1 Tax=unclassified Coleofasciculus TaxID=2692782 RepID=UPI00187F424D|nr:MULTISPECIES: leucine-rich repeat domain-containing protein [unclassified Coleofasciculus]MBE9125983.1 leucine-rich repeat domain-containing protein [Coleofasciculus sp. LEGE 07081]MBE9151177.1 leucine-rich repeat domain-containing protein [Coleofasciculus sp. LEGE 07092]